MTEPGRFLLLAGEDGAAWLAATGRPEVNIDVLAVGSDLVCDGDCHALCGIIGAGAILVRPDDHVAMRSVDGTDVDALLHSAVRASCGQAAGNDLQAHGKRSSRAG
ncbi:hypothetical protein ACIF83_44115 [Streptomyces sp. NPDC085866]|uniref:aromatic-ring hydroxylase C-terminal domain-containing protein n=1 Tax=Streptomyces sp. NPDC085866 TaxID=3365736 RepID=UPI0037CE900F